MKPVASPPCTSILAATAGFPPLEATRVVEALRQPPALHGIDRPRWRLDDLGQAIPAVAGYSRSGLSRLLRRLEVRRSRGRFSLHSPDLAYQTKLEWLARAVAAARADPDHVRLLYADEFTLMRQPSLAPVYAPCGHEPTVPLSAQANYTYRYSAALDLVSGQVDWLGAMIVGVDRLKRFLRRLRTAYPGYRLLLVWDNWPVHTHPAVLAEAASLGIELLWLPTYAPWTNPIEKRWRWLKQDVVHAHRLADQWPELKRQVAAFLDQFAEGSEALLRYVGLLLE